MKNSTLPISFKKIDYTVDILEELNRYLLEIDPACVVINNYLQKNESIEEVPASISDLLHAVFHKLKYEIKECIQRERDEVFPLALKRTHRETKELASAIEAFKETHALILKIVQKLRRLLLDYKVKEAWSDDFKECIEHVYKLENNLHKWINAEEKLLYPELIHSEEHQSAVRSFAHKV